jgi:hypothetical protein
MPTRLDRNQLLQLARLGAKARLAELDEERKAIEALLGAKGRGRPSGRRYSSSGRLSVTANESTGRRRRMSATQRRAVSVRMKKYWAGRRAAQKK